MNEASLMPVTPEPASRIRTVLEYGSLPDDELASAAEEAVRRDAVVTILGFPGGAVALEQFVRRWGEPMRRGGSSAAPSTPWIGDVRFRPDIESAERLPTQTFRELEFHTARSFERVRPRLFAMLMVDPGWTDEPAGQNGESLLLRWKVAAEELRAAFPGSAEADLNRLTSTPVAYRPWYVQKEVAEEPLLRRLPDGDIECRYWQGTLETLREQQDEIPDGARFLSALERWDRIVQSGRGAIEYSMQAGQLTLLDNRRVAHARRPFRQARSSDGQTVANPRHMFTAHLR
ncbi:MAG: TauD/TfdA family dioxygenase [Acidobacteriota bacterium]